MSRPTLSRILRTSPAKPSALVDMAQRVDLLGGFALEREHCCGYTFQLYARDKTRSSAPVPRHEAWSLPWAVCICNDLKGPCPD